MEPSTRPRSKYPYRALSLPTETRILTATPGKFDDDLICSLSHMSIPTIKPATVDANDLNRE